MDSSSSPASNRLAISFSSDVSYSSEASHTSTRTTSPATSSHQPSPLLDFHKFNASNIEPASNTLLDPHSKMERNAFQSVKMRRDKLISERVGEMTITNSTSQLQQPFQQPQALRPGTSISSQGTRSLTSNNWRTQLTNDNMYSPFESADSAPMSDAGRASTSFPISTQPRTDHQSAPMSYHNMVAFTDIQLRSCYAYCFDRGNGQYTRLIPADRLPPLQSVPTLQQGCQGMIVLPTPRLLPTNGCSSSNEPISLRTPPTTPTTPADNIQVSLPLRQRAQLGTDIAHSDSHTRPELPAQPARSAAPSYTAGTSNYNPLDPFEMKPSSGSVTNPSANAPLSTPAQSRIDTIVASIPSTPMHHSQNGSTASSSNNCHHGHNGAPTSSGGGGAPHHQSQRRTKIYCDKWVHEGVCAFTQQGCKYKHEMPFDKVTQHQLGLFHGLPAWWKKHQADLARQREVPQNMDAEGIPDSGNESGRSGLGLAEGAGAGVIDRMNDAFGNIHRSKFDGASGGPSTNLAWREQDDQEPGNKNNGGGQNHAGRGFGIASASGATGVRARGGISASFWNPSPFGPIAPPQRTAMQTLHASASPTRSSMTTNGGISTNNPYASLEALDDGKPGELSGGIRLG